MYRTVFKQTSKCSENEYRICLKLSFSQRTAHFLLIENFLQMFEISSKFSEHGKMLTFAGDGENLSKMQQIFLRKLFAEKVKFKMFGKTENGAKTKLCFTILC
jgi:hypothetical protein